MLSARECLEELLKLAKIKTELQPHQQRVVDRIQREDQPGLVVVHGLGSGKTLSSIGAQEEQRDAERLHRLRRQVAQLEDRVEGDGWKKMPSAPAEKKPDASGKNW